MSIKLAGTYRPAATPDDSRQERIYGRVTKPIRGGSEELVGARGFEPRTSSLSATRSNQLSYAPGSSFVAKFAL